MNGLFGRPRPPKRGARRVNVDRIQKDQALSEETLDYLNAREKALSQVVAGCDREIRAHMASGRRDLAARVLRKKKINERHLGTVRASIDKLSTANIQRETVTDAVAVQQAMAATARLTRHTMKNLSPEQVIKTTEELAESMDAFTEINGYLAEPLGGIEFASETLESELDDYLAEPAPASASVPASASIPVSASTSASASTPASSPASASASAPIASRATGDERALLDMLNRLEVPSTDPPEHSRDSNTKVLSMDL